MAKGRVLLAHGNTDCRKIFGSVLSFGGYDVEVVEDAESALRLLTALPFDIVVTDLYVQCEGDECLPRSIRANPFLAHLPIIVITGWTTEPHRRVALGAGADEFLPMPVRPRELLDLVTRVLEERSAPMSSLQSSNGTHDRPVANGF